MFHPQGPQSASVYWRRRLVLLASTVVLLALITLMLRVVFADGGSSATAGEKPPATLATTPVQTTYAPPTDAGHSRSIAAGPAPSQPAPSQQVPSHPGSANRTRSTAGANATASSPPAPRDCSRGQLRVVAVTDRSHYSTGSEPVLMMQVTNTAAAPCLQDLADKQVVMRVYNGESRVWGSHDCKVVPGTDVHTLAPRAPVRISIVWSGRSARPGCSGNRQLIGAGTYTLYVSLAGEDGAAAQFSIT